MFVVDRHHRPLMPCTPTRARMLLDRGRAVVHRHTPFVIRLKDRTADTSEVGGVEIGIDPGSKSTGIAVFRTSMTPGGRARHGLFALELGHRGGQIRDRLSSRATQRRGRRSRNLRYRAPRFDNRTRQAGWLPPSLQHRVDTTASWTDRLMRWAPVRIIHVERVAFDTRAMAVGKPLSEAEYQHGTLSGTEIREYLLAKWRHSCAYCGATGVPLNIDHIHPRSQGGSNRIANLAIACVTCNQKKSNQSVAVFLKRKPALLTKILAQAKESLRDAAAMNATRDALVQALESIHPDVRMSSGGRTKWNRQRTRTPKTHTLDALCVGVLDVIFTHPHTILSVTATGRGTYRRTAPDRYGFPRLTMPRVKQHFGYSTGDLVRASIPKGKNQGSHTGRVAVRASGRFNIKTRHGLIQGVAHNYVRLLQRSDGYAYTTRSEGALHAR
ncbi:RNA-guided endonuclease IscB [Streptomyces sp. NPDC056656]|uniref:RNA-guided endonuclease IscB n=1 Tax=Streptomyces sp. NPDC056656 TaxID=3345895 RepID=UPI0036C299AC